MDPLGSSAQAEQDSSNQTTNAIIDKDDTIHEKPLWDTKPTTTNRREATCPP